MGTQITQILQMNADFLLVQICADPKNLCHLRAKLPDKN